ncbi:MAG: hypothetical protein ACTHLW_07150 [Verrucomicrobiota bacterium]
MAGLLVGAGGAWLLFTHGLIAGIGVLLLATAIAIMALINVWKRKFAAAAFGLLLATLVAGLGVLICQHPDISKMSNGFFVTFEVTPRIVGFAALVASGLGIVASIAPSISVARMSVVEGLKTLD